MASHIGKLPIAIPAGVEVKIEGQNFSAKGAKGSDSYVVPEGITAAVEGNEIVLTAADDLRPTRAKHGLARSIMAGMVKGVHDGYSKTLEIVGTGYRAVAKGQGIEFFLGYSHTINRQPARRHHPEGDRRQPRGCRRHRQAGRGPGCRQHPQAARSGTLQGQGHQVLR
mgnify:CR=1 FL=1